ncbi:MAG: carbonic anhydrase [Candidatus Saganbacteria bacterium]|nr:carbonic anhydrase [Candidatus Saganbacteria bacterium]
MDKIIRFTFIVLFLLTALVMSVLAEANISRDAALKLLKDGNRRFADMKLLHPNLNSERLKETAANGQKPFAVVLACSDSRVPVESLFDRGIGDIFVVRVAGNIASDSSVIGSVEYGLEHLHVPLLVILGHSDCGAVKAAVSDAKVSGHVVEIKNIISSVVGRVRKKQPSIEGEDLLNAVIKANVLETKQNLLAKSSEISSLFGKKEIKIVTAIYDIRSGKVKWF